VLDQALFYYFGPDPHGTALDAWNPTILDGEANLGYYESGEQRVGPQVAPREPPRHPWQELDFARRGRRMHPTTEVAR